MKRICLIITVILLMQCFAGCQADIPPTTLPTETTLPITEPSTQPETTTVPPLPVTPENLCSVAVPISTENSYAEDDTLIFSYAYQTMHLPHQDRDVADKIIIDFLARGEETRTRANELLDLAQSKDHTAAGFAPYTYQVHYDPMRIDQGVLSLHGHITQSGDFSHSNVQCLSASYDMVTGDVLTLGSILYRADAKDELCKIVIAALEKRTDIDLYEDFRTSIENRFKRDESQDEDFYFSVNGLCFYFSPYEIAPYSEGMITVEIPYHQLTGVIGDAYFPAEQTNSNGTIRACSFAEAENFTQFTEVIVEAGSTKLLLATDSIVQDIRIRLLTWNSGNTSPQVQNTIFAANTLSSQEAILMDAEFDGSYPRFMVSYTIDGISCDYYLVKDSASGSIELVPKN